MSEGSPAQHVRVRFAPSPTGELTVGGARTALYNYLFAKHHRGEILLRIEDTDQKRFVPGSMDRFFEDLTWLGVEFDGDPVIQSSRVERHHEVAEALVAQGAAYYEPSDTSVEVGQKHDEAEYRSGRTVYRGADRSQSQKPEGPYIIRLKVPTEGTVTLHDAIRGAVSFDWSTVDDVVLVKSNGMSSYHLAAMVDDHDAGITHVIRSEEWLPSSPKHLFLYQAMEWTLPVMAHVPVVLASDGKKMSKRIHGEAVWVQTYRNRGYLPQALRNYLALLGWNPGGDREQFAFDELIEAFSLERVHKAGAIFDEQKLNAFQNHYVQQQSLPELTKIVRPFAPTNIPDDQLERLVSVVQSRLGALSQIVDLADFVTTATQYPPQLLVFKKSTLEITIRGLAAALDTLEQLPEASWLDQQILQQALVEVVAKQELSNGDVFWPVRVALTGKEHSPSPVECLWVLGQAESLQRLRTGLEQLKQIQ